MSRFGNVLKSYVRQLPIVGSVFNNVELLSNLFGKGDEFDEGTGNVFNQLAKGADNYMRATFHTGLTDEELQRNALMRENRQTAMSDEVKGLEAAGLNAGLVYGSSPSVGNPQPMPGNSGAGLSDLLQLAMLPAQIANLNAQTSNIKAQTGLTKQKTLTEEQITRLQSIAVEWQPAINAEQVAQMSANIDKAQSDILVNVAQENYINNQSIAQEITNAYLPNKYLSEIGNLDAAAASAKATAAFTRVQYEFARDNKFLMSSNDTLLLGTYIASLFNVDKSDVVNVVKKGVKYAKEELPKDLKPWSKVDSDEAMNWFIEHAKSSTKN